MASELLNIMLGFQPDSPELQQKRVYDHAAREFVGALNSIASHHFQKGADTSQDILTVCSYAYAVTFC